MISITRLCPYKPIRRNYFQMLSNLSERMFDCISKGLHRMLTSLYLSERKTNLFLGSSMNRNLQNKLWCQQTKEITQNEWATLWNVYSLGSMSQKSHILTFFGLITPLLYCHSHALCCNGQTKFEVKGTWQLILYFICEQIRFFASRYKSIVNWCLACNVMIA